MRNHYSEADLVIEVREDTDSDVIATGYGRAVPYAVETDLSGVRESFGPNAFDPEQVKGRPFAYRHGEPIGIITGAENREDGLYIDFQILNTAPGRDAATLMRNGASTGLSVGFQPTKSVWARSRDKVQHLAATLLEVSQTHIPAYGSASNVLAIREEGETMSEVIEAEVRETPAVDVEAREAIADVRKEIAALVHVAEPVNPLSEFRSFGEYTKAVWEGRIEARALADQITDNNPGVLPPNWAMQVKNIIDLGRPGITAFGVESAGASGMDFNWPYFDGDLSLIVAAQPTGEKNEVNSVQIDIKKGTASLATYAAASDISYQLLMRSSPSYLDAHNRIMAASYALVTDNVFVDAMLTASTPYNYDFSADTDGSAFREAVFGASVAVESATGAPAGFVLAASDVFTKIGGWSTFVPAPYGPNNVSGVATAGTLGVAVSGLPVIHDRNLANGAIIVSNSTAAKWIEDGPRVVTDEDVAKLGRNVAIYGLGVSAAYNAAGIVSLEVIPAP